MGSELSLTRLSPRRRGHCKIDDPSLPNHLVLVGVVAKHPRRSTPLLLGKVHSYLAAAALLLGIVEVQLAEQVIDALVDGGVEVVVDDAGEGHVENVEGGGRDVGEHAVEEDQVQDTWALSVRTNSL